MVKFMCKNCNYRYNSETNQENKMCPYCGKREIVPEPDADELLKDSE